MCMQAPMYIYVNNQAGLTFPFVGLIICSFFTPEGKGNVLFPHVRLHIEKG